MGFRLKDRAFVSSNPGLMLFGCWLHHLGSHSGFFSFSFFINDLTIDKIFLQTTLLMLITYIYKASTSHKCIIYNF